MKIMICDATLMQGGAERVISILSDSLCKMGHEVEILLYYNRPIFYKLNESVFVHSDEDHIGKSGVLKHIRWRRKYIKERNPDVVISFLAPFNMINIVAMAGLKIPLIVADRNDPKRVPENFLIRKARDFLYRFASGIVLQNETNRSYFSRTVQKKSAVIFNPLNLGEYEGAALRCEEKSKSIVSVARVIEQKNPMMLLNAFSTLSNEFPDYNLVFYGDGDMREDVLEEAKRLGLSGRVEAPGAEKNVFEKTKSAELFVMTSNYEGMPNALIEAMCMGLPCISTKVSGAVDVIKNGENGLLVDCNDEAALVKAMRKMLTEEDFRRKCANKASELSEDLRTEKITIQWIDFINKIRR